MSNQAKVQLTIYLSIEIRAKLQALAAQQMLAHPQKNFSAASIAASILNEYFDHIKAGPDEQQMIVGS
jgi:hypothetical protein